MLDENERRVRALIRRVDRRDDYGTLLMRGEVARALADVEDPEAWRADMRRQARQDRLHIATVKTASAVIAALRHPADSSGVAMSPETVQWLGVIGPAVNAARDLGHDWWLLRDAQEGVAGCKNCDALGYVNAEEDVMDGELFEVPCSGVKERAPRSGVASSPPPMARNRKDVEEIIAAVKDHGWRVEPSADGYKLYAPSGSGIVLIHKTPSARNWQRKAVSQIRRYDPEFKWKGR